MTPRVIKLFILPVSDNILFKPILAYSLALWSRVLLEKLTGSQLVKTFPAFCGIRRLVTAFPTIRHLSLS